MRKPPLIVLVGPTAVGKSAVALSLAKRINAEIVSCDSMQVYRGMDILTSKPSLIQRRRIRHHLLDVVSPTREYNVSRYRRDAVRALKAIVRKGKVPLLVGGTGLYMSVLIDGIFRQKAGDKKLRRLLAQEAAETGSPALHARLSLHDPAAAAKIHPNDTKRIIRALEVFLVCGRTISSLQRERRGLADQYQVHIVGLDLARQELYQRIERRVEQMFRKGLVQEVRRLLALRLSKTAAGAIGIREVKGYLCGEYDLAQATYVLKRNTRWYSRRQLSWFRKDTRIRWLAIEPQQTPAAIARQIHHHIPQGLLGER